MINTGIKAERNNLKDGLAAVAAIIIARGFLSVALSRKESRGSHIYLKGGYSSSPEPTDEVNGRCWYIVWIDNEGHIRTNRVEVPKPGLRHG